jgi:hypothetical protein
MKRTHWFFLFLVSVEAFSAPSFKAANPDLEGLYPTNSADLCATARETLAYLNRGAHYDPLVIHEGKIFTLPMAKIKSTLSFICTHQKELKNPKFLKANFDFVQWLPDVRHAKTFSTKPLVANVPPDKILMTKYYVHLAKGTRNRTSKTPYALYGRPEDETNLSLEEAQTKPQLTRFKYGKQAILKGALANKKVPTLVYLSREDLESALLQGTVVTQIENGKNRATFNVDRNNSIAYNRDKSPYQQERYWYFKQVDGIKGYGKDGEHKITVNLHCTFAADLEQLGLGKLLMIEYKGVKGMKVHRLGILADTGGAFVNNLYQVDYLSGAYPNKETCYRANRHLPNYVSAYFMVLKDNK